MKLKKYGVSTRLSRAFYAAALILMLAASGCATIDYDLAGANDRFDWREVLDGC